MAKTNTTAGVVDEFTYFDLPGTIIGTFGVVSNVLLLVAFIKDPLKCFRNSATYLVINLSVSDCIASLLCLLLNIAPRASKHPIWIFFMYWIGCVSIVSITSISIDRFLIVASPIKHRILMKGKVMILWIIAIWIANFVIPVFMLFTNIHSSSGREGLCTYGAIVVILSSVMYSSTYYKLKKQSRNIASQNSTESRAQEIRILKEKRFLKTIIIIACIAFVCIVPYMIFYLNYDSLSLPKDKLISKAIETPTFFIFYTNFAVNPVIYILRLPNYRKTFHLLYCRRTTFS